MAPEPDTVAITVAEALRLPELQRGMPEVIAGAEGLERPVRWVHTSEVQNVAELLSGGELLLTTGMAFGADPATHRRIAEQLADVGLAALVIELGVALDAVPPQMVQAAAERGLTVVALHREVRFVRVTEAIHTELVNRRYELLREGDRVRDRLIEILLGGDGIAEVLRALCEQVGNPVFLEGTAGELLFHAGDEEALDAWERARRRGAAGILARPVPMGHGRRTGRLVALPVRRPLGELDAIVISHATSIISLALLRARTEEELLVREHGNLLAGVLAGSVSGAEAARRAARFGFRPSGDGLLAVAIAERPEHSGASRAALVGDLQRALGGQGISTLAGGRTRRDPLLAIVALPDPDPVHRADPVRRAELCDRIAVAARRTWDNREPGSRVILVVSGPVGWDGVGGALELAARSLPCATALGDRPWFDTREIEIDRILYTLDGGGELSAFVHRTLGPLVDHDASHRVPLLPTLEALCAHGGRKAEAARVLHLHRQALYHRIARIEDLLGASVADPDELLTLQVALRARRLLGP